MQPSLFGCTLLCLELLQHRFLLRNKVGSKRGCRDLCPKLPRGVNCLFQKCCHCISSQGGQIVCCITLLPVWRVLLEVEPIGPVPEIFDSAPVVRSGFRICSKFYREQRKSRKIIEANEAIPWNGQMEISVWTCFGFQTVTPQFWLPQLQPSLLQLLLLWTLPETGNWDFRNRSVYQRASKRSFCTDLQYQYLLDAVSKRIPNGSLELTTFSGIKVQHLNIKQSSNSIWSIWGTSRGIKWTPACALAAAASVSS